MKALGPILAVVAAIIALWYAAAVPMNIQEVLTQAERAGAVVEFIFARIAAGVFGSVEGRFKRAIRFGNERMPIARHIKPVARIVLLQGPFHYIQTFVDHLTAQNQGRHRLRGRYGQKFGGFVAQNNFAQFGFETCGLQRHPCPYGTRRPVYRKS